MNEPLTVGIITYNEEKRIQGCLESLVFLKEKVSNIFIVLVDNNSADQTLELADQILKKLNFEFLLLKRQENNLAAARNDILKAAQTRWIYMLDADCQLDNETWPQLTSDWSENPKIAARAGSQRFRPTFEILILLDEMRKSYLGHFGSAQMRSVGNKEFLEHVSSTHVLYDKLALMEAGGFNPLLKSSAEDLDLSLRLRKKGFLLQFNPRSFLWHDLASTWTDWATKAFRNGIWQTRLLAYNSEILKTRRPWPGILLFFLPLLGKEFLVSAFMIYVLVVLFLSFSAEINFVKKIKLAVLFILTHGLYAIGEMVGFILALKDLTLKNKLPSSTKV